MVGSVLLAALAAPAVGDMSVSFADSSYTNTFMEQWSYDQQDQAGHDKHFDVGAHGGRTALRVRIYSDDKSFQASSSTAPRTELSERSKSVFVSGQEFSVSWDWQLESYTSPYYFAFFQLFGGTGPNIFLRWEFDSYILWCEECSTARMDFDGSALDDVGKWVNWEVRFKLSSGSDGYLTVLRDGKEVKSYSGATSKGQDHYLKMGLYTQHVETAMDASAFLSNLQITGGSGPSYCAKGIENNGACCAAACGGCGGSGCSDLPGGADQCCSTKILDNGEQCKSADDVGCVIPALLV